MKAFSAFFMCPVSHTFPAYNGNEMPPWYTIIFFVYGRVVYKPRCLLLCFLCGTFRQFARAHERLSPQCPGTPRVKPHEKSRLFSDRGAESFLWSAFLSGNSFFRAGFCGVAWAWKGPFPCGGVPSWPKEEKRLPRPLPARGARLQTEAEPGYFPPQTLRLSAGRSNHSGLFPCKNLPQFSPTLRRELTKKKGRGTMSTTR